MITYKNSLFGFSLIFHVHGSALWQAMVPALLSTLVLLIIVYTTEAPIENSVDSRLTDHVYTIGAYIAFFSFLLTFRLNFAYQRYWEGATALHQMLSKWLDVATLMSAFHYQSRQYDSYRPPAFGHHNKLRNVTRERERVNEMTEDETVEQLMEELEEKEQQDSRYKRSWKKFFLRRKSPKMPIPPKKGGTSSDKNRSASSSGPAKNISGYGVYKKASQRIPIPRNFHEQFNSPLLQSTRNMVIKRNSQKSTLKEKNSEEICASESTFLSLNRDQSQKTVLKSVEQHEIPCPSLFLQELVHLVSLLSGVAMSTLRNDIEGAESPLAEYFPGQPIPAVNPDDLPAEVKEEWDSSNSVISSVNFILGLSRDDKHRTLYNAGRPFQVLGGVSDREIEELQKAHGPYAKVALCSMYMQEFVSRESLHGSTGSIPGPLLSRVTHVLSDGMAGYNQARKIAYNPFPFPHAQMTAFFTLVAIFIFPILYYSFVNALPFALILNFVTVMCFQGIHSVARELGKLRFSYFRLKQMRQCLLF